MKSFFTFLFSLLLIAAILAPSIVKLSHAMYEHQEQLCTDTNAVHVHNVELDCDFQKFKVSPQHYPNFASIQKNHIVEVKEKDTNSYSFLSKYQKLHFALRGPPVS